MKTPYEIWVAVRYLKARRRESFISLITWLSAAGVVLGVTALITVLSVMSGFEEDLREKILGVTAHLTIHRIAGELDGHQDAVRQVESVEGVVGATPYVMSQVMLMAGGKVQAAIFRGFDVASAGRVTDIEKYVVEGRFKDLAGDAPSILIGRAMASELGLSIGSAVEVVTTIGAPTALRMIPRARAFRVVGIFASGMHDYDAGLVFVSLEAAQDFLKLGRRVTGIEVRVTDIYQARQLAREIEDQLGPGHWTRDWMEMNRILFRALKLQKIVMALILALIVLVAAFNIASSLIMVVLEKRREIGIFKAMGANNRSVRRIFVLEGLVIGGLGTIVGLLGAAVLCLLLKRYQFIDLPGDVYYLDTLPVVMKIEVFALVALCAVALCYLATLYPSWQAARLDPVETIRHE